MKKAFIIIGVVGCCLMLFGSTGLAFELESDRFEKGKKQAEALTDGEVIDQSNWEKISYLMPPAPVKWVENGWLIMTIGDMGYPYTTETRMDRLTKNNVGKFDVSSDGDLIDKATGKPPVYFEGLPFPKSNLDFSDPLVAVKIMYNFHFMQYWAGSFSSIFDFCWVSHKAFERQMFGMYNKLTYFNRLSGQIPNPHDVLSKNLIVVLSPYDVQGLATLNYTNKAKDDDLWTYIPALRRIRRMSPANTSDAFVGSDFCNDDANVYKGQIRAFNWKYLGPEMSLQIEVGKPFALVRSEKYQGWMVPMGITGAKYGYETPGYKGAPWTQGPINTVWNPRPFYVIDGIPKDPYYNFGRTILTVDQDMFWGLYKVSYDRAMDYWKTFYQGARSYYVPGKEDDYNGVTSATNWVFDERSRHASICHTADFGYGSDYELMYSLPFSEADFSTKSLLRAGK